MASTCCARPGQGRRDDRAAGERRDLPPSSSRRCRCWSRRHRRAGLLRGERGAVRRAAAAGPEAHLPGGARARGHRHHRLHAADDVPLDPLRLGREHTLHPFAEGPLLGSGAGPMVLAEAGLDGASQAARSAATWPRGLLRPGLHVAPDRAERALHFRVQVVEVRREAQAAGDRRTDGVLLDAVLLVEGRGPASRRRGCRAGKRRRHASARDRGASTASLPRSGAAPPGELRRARGARAWIAGARAAVWNRSASPKARIAGSSRWPKHSKVLESPTARDRPLTMLGQKPGLDASC